MYYYNFIIHINFIQLNAEEFHKIQDAAQPDILAVISDEVGSDASNARSRKSVDRSLKWLSESLALRDPAVFLKCFCLSYFLEQDFILGNFTRWQFYKIA